MRYLHVSIIIQLQVLNTKPGIGDYSVEVNCYRDACLDHGGIEHVFTINLDVSSVNSNESIELNLELTKGRLTVLWKDICANVSLNANEQYAHTSNL